MPRKLINNYTFYKIVCLDNAVDLSYVGSTADFNKRKSTHKSDCYNQKRPAYNYKVYRTIRENGGWSNFKMIEIGKRDQLTLRQAEQIEEQYRKELNAEMNGRRCFVTEEERKEYGKEYNQTESRKQQKKEYSKEYRKINPDYYKNWCENNKERVKEYNQTESRKALNNARVKKYNQTDKAKAKQQTTEYKALNNARVKKYYAKKKLEKEQLKNNKE